MRSRLEIVQVAARGKSRLRESLGLSQAPFSLALNVSVGTVRAWEQGARIPDGSSRRLLEVVEHDPEVILRTVRGGAGQARGSTAA